MNFDMFLPEMVIDSATVSGLVTVSEEILGNIDLVMETNRCTLDLKTCFKENTINFKGMCKVFSMKNAFYSKVFDSLQPNFDCPLKAGNYTLRETSFDLMFARPFPIDGHIFIMTFKWIQVDRKNKTKRVLMCFYIEVKVFVANKKER